MLLLVLVLVTVGYPLWSYMTGQYRYGERTIASRYIKKAWNRAAYKFLHVIAQVKIHDIDQSCWIMLNLVEKVVVEEAGQSVEEVQSYTLMGDAKDEDAEEVRSAGLVAMD
ncbi:hypothetical protein CTI12_AA460720 [Artemisia annua]|uniref:Uncharacterized protein n=1 Tax=Artemisia annua TaxID=35608 RepID=A0A2U1LS08_ARTAN|nr:hypothetical protein CTI12_AA460720 [Artemisia annua]